MDDRTVSRLYFDLGSPYSWLAFERTGLLGIKPRLEPILIGGIFVLRGYGSWSGTDTREEHISEVERRAGEYGLGSVRWPDRWPDNTLKAMRCAVWADRHRQLETFTRQAFRAAFQGGRDLSDEQVLAGLATESELDSKAMLDAIRSDEIKNELRTRTEAAWGLGVAGAPTLLVGREVFYGDDRLEAGAEAVKAEHTRR